MTLPAPLRRQLLDVAAEALAVRQQQPEQPQTLRLEIEGVGLAIQVVGARRREPAGLIGLRLVDDELGDASARAHRGERRH